MGFFSKQVPKNQYPSVKNLVIASQSADWRGNPLSQIFWIRIPEAVTSVTASE